MRTAFGDCSRDHQSDRKTNIPGNNFKYSSIDNAIDKEQAVNYHKEILNRLNPPGMPIHNLELIENVPVMFLRNLYPPKFCNGMRMIVKKLPPYVLKVEIITGQGIGERVFIQRIPLIPQDFSFGFKRLQFTVRLSFAMRINKSPGHSLKVAGLHLMEHCFSHGQLYVGCSRVGDGLNLSHLSVPMREPKMLCTKFL